MTIYTYQNKRNKHKFLEVHNDGHYHNSVRQYIKTENQHSPQYVGARFGRKATLHRWRIANLDELLEDYILVGMR